MAIGGSASDTHHGADVAALDTVDILLAETVEDHELLDLMFLHDIIALAEADRHAGLQGAAGDTANGDPSDIRGILQGGDQHLRRSLHLGRSRNDLEDRIQQGGDVAGRLTPVFGHPALLGAAVNCLEIQLVLGRSQVEHQVEHLFLDFVRAAVRLVHLVDDHDRLLAHFNGFVQHETGLRHAAFESIDQQQDTVRHVQHALDFSAEIAVPGRVDDVDLDILVHDRHVLGQDGDTSLAFEIVVVEDEFAQVLGAADQVGLVDHPVHERRLAVVDMCDNRDVPYVHIFFSLIKSRKNTDFRPQYKLFIVFLYFQTD